MVKLLLEQGVDVNKDTSEAAEKIIAKEGEKNIKGEEIIREKNIRKSR